MKYPKPAIQHLAEKKLVGKHLLMSLTTNKTSELWKSFMLRRKEITNHLTSDVISLQVYEPSYFEHFNPTNQFKKWALIEVSSFKSIPAEMESFTLTSGKYAVFSYKGSSADQSIFQYIYMEWLPNSIYRLDNRPHFEVLGNKYKNNDPNSEEDIWIPIKNK